MQNPDLRGGCFCGRIRYRISRPPLSSGICHCSSCRRASGAQSVAWFTVEAEGFDVLSGRLSTHRSSPKVEWGFCGKCGSSITYRHDDHPTEVQLTNATLDDPDAVPPTEEGWLSEKIGWAATDPARRHHDGPS